MPRILIAGCGYVGIAAVKLFLQESWDVVAWSRSGKLGDEELAKAVTVRAVDLADRKDAQQNSFAASAVVHCASSRGGDVDDYRQIYRDGVQNLAAAFPDARLIFTSSTSVYAQGDGSWVNEDSPAEPATETGNILRQAEEIVLANAGIVFRLGGIYGPGRSFLLQSVIDRTASVSATIDRYVNQIHRDDVASAIRLLASQNEITPTRIFNVVDDTPVLRSEILRWLSAQLQVPLADSQTVAGRKRGHSDKRVSNVKLRSLGWSPLYPSYREGFLRSVLPASRRL